MMTTPSRSQATGPGGPTRALDRRPSGYRFSAEAQRD
jgi:hypothetical protein